MSHDAAIEPPESFDAFQRRLIEIEPHLPKRLRKWRLMRLSTRTNLR
jgi:hypothetical protein